MNKKISDLFNFLDSIQEKEILVKKVTGYGYQFEYDTVVCGSVSKYGFFPLLIEEYPTPSTNDNRPGTIKTSTQFICVHDTGSSAESAGSKAHASYVYNGGGGTSWHYSVGDDMVYHQIPDNEVAYHAGDGTLVDFGLINTGIKYEGVDKVDISIKDEYYYFNDVKTLIKAPVLSYKQNDDGTFTWTSDGIPSSKMRRNGKNVSSVEEAELLISERKPLRINDEGLFYTVKDGYYFMGKTYYSPGYNYVSNRGGNNNSIGMETMVNKGSDLYKTWHNTAKLCAKLALENNLGTDRVKPHHFFSGKECPQTLRMNGLYPNFKKMLEAEYIIRKEYSDCDIKLESLNKEYLADNGRVIKVSDKDVILKYVVSVSCDGETVTKEYTSLLKKYE